MSVPHRACQVLYGLLAIDLFFDVFVLNHYLCKQFSVF
jgi:hypothetical protein